MINKLYINKVLEHLSPNASTESENVSQFNNYVIDSMMVLQNKLKRSVPIPFIKTKDGSLVFVIRNSAAIEFKFTDLIDVQMGLFYFKIALGKKIMNPLMLIEHENTATKCELLPTIAHSNVTCYTALSNDWLTLGKSGCFEVYSNFNLEIKYPIN